MIATGTDRTTTTWASWPSCQPAIEGIRKRPIANAIIPKARKLDQRSIGPVPPATSEKPSTSSRLPTTEPVSEPRTTSVSPWLIAIRAMISSGALPKVALTKPPIPGPVCSAVCSVASPISQASGISASADSRNSVVSSTSVKWSSAITTGPSASPAKRIRFTMGARLPYPPS